MPDRRRLWPQTRGVITKTEIAESRRPFDDTYEAIVYFSYTVRDTTYTGRDLIACEFRSQAQELVRRHPPIGTTETVYYDPAQPAQAVLEQTIATAEQVADISALFIARYDRRYWPGVPGLYRSLPSPRGHFGIPTLRSPTLRECKQGEPFNLLLFPYAGLATITALAGHRT
jgi:Protein of unknown function (DUF3592)